MFTRKFLTALITALILSISLAQTMLVPSAEGDTVRLSSDEQIRYYADYNLYTLTIPQGLLTDLEFKFPGDVAVNQETDGLIIDIRRPFEMSLSTDEKTLTFAPKTLLGSEPIQLSDDERSPIMYYLSNAKPADVAGTLATMYSNLQVEIDERQRAILVLVNPQDRELVDTLVKALDAPRPQVMFEAEIVEINQSMTQSLGINYDSIFTFKLTEGEVKSPLSFGTLGRSGLSLTFGLNLLKTNGAANVLARPRVTTLDGVQAQINATQSFPVVTASSNGQQSVQNITTGIKLTMLPRISPDGLVEAELSISVSTPTGITSQNVPTYSSREASTTVRVANGEPIAIGGLFEKRSLQGEQKVPLLGDIPVLGALFTSTSTEQRETDLVIIVTPRIVDMPSVDVVNPTTSAEQTP